MATLADLQARLLAYKTCELKIIQGAQEYKVEDKWFKRADLGKVQSIIRELENEIKALTPSRKRMRSQSLIFRRN